LMNCFYQRSYTDDKHKERCSTTLIIGLVQIKTIVRKWGVMVRVCKPSTQEVEAGGS
jgi:hypothetical protein